MCVQPVSSPSVIISCVVIILDLSELNAGESATAIAGVGKSKEVEMETQSWVFSDPFIGPFTLQCEQRRRQVGHRAVSRLCPQEATYSTPEPVILLGLWNLLRYQQINR